MFIIGLTGGIGSGKSEVAKLLTDQGFTVINSDLIGHNLLLSDNIKHTLVEEFGEHILTNNEIDRTKLAKIIFTEPSAKKKINQILHPLIIAEIMKTIEQAEKNGKNVIIIESALIGEEEDTLPPFLHALILVSAPEEIRIQRLVNFRKMTPDEAKQRIQSQRNPDEKIKFATWTIQNDADFDKLKLEVDKVVKEIRNVVSRL